MAKIDEKSENNSEGKKEVVQATFIMLSQYVKDASLEVAKAAYSNQSEKTNVSVDVGVGVGRLEGDRHEVSLKLRGEAKNEVGEVSYIAEIEYVGVFELKDFPEEHLLGVLSVDGAHLVFPFVRHEFMRLIESSGYRAPAVDPINFRAVFEQSQQMDGEVVGQA